MTEPGTVVPVWQVSLFHLSPEDLKVLAEEQDAILSGPLCYGVLVFADEGIIGDWVEHKFSAQFVKILKTARDMDMEYVLFWDTGEELEGFVVYELEPVEMKRTVNW